MPKPSPFTGVLTAIVTPFTADGGLDLDALARHVEAQIAGGVDGIVPCGTTGENVTLSAEEQAKVVRRVVEVAHKRVAVVAGAGSNNTADSIAKARAAREAGADGIMLVAPYYNKPSQDGMFAHFAAVIREVPVPTVIYNVPGRTSSDILPETIARLAALPEVVAVKEATGSMVRASQILARCSDQLTLLSGDDFTAFPAMAIGARGVISVASNVAPRWLADLWAGAKTGAWDKARLLHHKIQPLTELLFADPSPAPAKAALAMMGLMREDVRLPLIPLGDASKERLHAQLTRDGLL